MMSDQEMNELSQIEQYLAGQLTADEKQLVEERIKTDLTFSTKVEQMRQVTRLLRTAHIEQRAQQTLQNLYRKRRQHAQRVTYYRYGVGASAFTAFFAWIVFLSFANIHLPLIEDDLMLIRGQKSAGRELTVNESPYKLLLIGQQELRKGNYIQASNHLKQALYSTDLRPYYRQAGQWYLTLAYLYSDQPRLAQQRYEEVQAVDKPEFIVNKIDQWKVYSQILRRKWL